MQKYYAAFVKNGEHEYPPELPSTYKTRQGAEEEAEELIEEYGNEDVTVVIVEITPIAQMVRQISYKTTPIEPTEPARKASKKGAK